MSFPEAARWCGCPESITTSLSITAESVGMDSGLRPPAGPGMTRSGPNPGLDESRQFIPLKIAVLTVSDTRSLDDDKSGSTLAERIEKAGHAVAVRAIVTDDAEKIRQQVDAWIADEGVDVVITTGGTGFTGRDV